MELVTFVLLFAGGLFSGIINTIIGGGSLISVPLLMISGLPAHLAIGTNRFAMVFNTGVGAIDYYRKINYDIKLGLLLAVLTSIGSYLGANIVLTIDEKTLQYIIATLMLIMGGIIFKKNQIGLEEKKISLTRRSWPFFLVLSFLLGIYGGFYGAGVSTMFTFVFVIFFGMSFIKSSGITRFIVTIISIIAALTFLINMKVDFLFGIVLAISFIAGAKIGVKLAFKVGNVWIRKLFLILVAFSTIRLLLF